MTDSFMMILAMRHAKTGRMSLPDIVIYRSSSVGRCR
jgi:hypothetical protein